MYKIWWISSLESIKGISIGLAGGLIVLVMSNKDYSISQFIIGLLILIFLSTTTTYLVNLKLYKNRKEIKDIKKHL
jgi:uncharacterized membrane protein YcaP (DUF421 family)